MFSTRLRSLCIRRSPTRQFQALTRHFSLKNPESVKRPQANSVRSRLLPFDKFHSRSAKSGNKRKPGDLIWIPNDLNFYHISLNSVDPLEFFALQELPQPSVDQELLSTVDPDAMQQAYNKQLAFLLDCVMIPEPGDSRVVDFMLVLLEVMGYLGKGRVTRLWLKLPLFIRGELKHTKSDVCVVDMSQNEILLLVQEDKKTEFGGLIKAETQLVAGAVAAFNHNNLHRETVKLPPLTEKVMPGIIMTRTSPTFFKIPVTETLSSHIRTGTPPPHETRVTYCYPPVHYRRRLIEGMRPLDNRLEFLKCYEAFKMIVGR